MAGISVSCLLPHTLADLIPSPTSDGSSARDWDKEEMHKCFKSEHIYIFVGTFCSYTLMQHKNALQDKTKCEREREVASV
jgi:hypothetical protein